MSKMLGQLHNMELVVSRLSAYGFTIPLYDPQRYYFLFDTCHNLKFNYIKSSIAFQIVHNLVECETIIYYSYINASTTHQIAHS